MQQRGVLMILCRGTSHRNVVVHSSVGPPNSSNNAHLADTENDRQLVCTEKSRNPLEVSCLCSSPLPVCHRQQQHPLGQACHSMGLSSSSWPS